MHMGGVQLPALVFLSHLACACGYSRPVLESIIASLLCHDVSRIT